MIPIGVMLLVTGAAFLGFARPMHEGWRDMNRRMGASGVRGRLPLTEFFASRRGFAVLRGAGIAGIAVGAALLLGGLVLP